MLSVNRITSTEEFSALREEWNRLLSTSNADTAFLTWEWAFSWWETFRTADTSLYVLVVRDQERVVGIAPLVLRRRHVWGFFLVNQIEFLGAEIAHGDYLDFIIDSCSDERAILLAVFTYLEQHSREWEFLCLREVPEQSVSLQHTAEIARERRYRFTQVPMRTCPYLTLPETWESLEASLHKGWRRNLRRQRRHLQDELEATFGLFDQQRWEGEVSAFWSLHEKRWNSKGETGSFVDPKKREFYRKIALRYMEKDCLRLYFLSLGQTHIAAVFGIKYGNRFYHLQSGLDSAWSRYSVGQVLLAHVLEKVIEEGCTEYDFLRGTEEYKYDWGASDKSTLGLTIVNRRTKAIVTAAVNQVRKRII